MRTPPDDGLEAIGALQEPLRRALYRYVVSRRTDVSRNEAAEAVGIQRTLAAFHLDKLVDAGLLEASFKRLTDRAGPGAGRPAKVYRRVDVDLEVSLPPRQYVIAAEMLAEVVEETGSDSALHSAAHRSGRARGELAKAAGANPDGAAPDLEKLLTQHGFEPQRDGDVIRLQNCPFHQLSRQYPPLICGMNLAMLSGLVEGAGLTGVEVRMDAAPGRCCVALNLESAGCEALPSSKTNRR